MSDDLDDRLDAAADEIERLLAAGRKPDLAALAARFDLELEALAAQAAAVEALGPGLLAPAPRPRQLPGARIGRYVVLEELGRGGMGVVYRARDESLRREVALKQLQAIGDERRRSRFLREMRALAKLDHPHVVPVWDNGIDGQRPFLVMPVIEGESLASRLKRRGPLQPRVAATFVRDLADAVAHAHARGVLHRDIKPENVLVTAEEQVVLTDFGLAKDLFGGEGQSLSADGQSMGTPGYWAPEQARGKLDQVGPATDVYGLGATLYACLTGEPPIRDGATFLECLQAVSELVPEPPSQLRDGLDPGLDDLCLRCLEKDAGARLESAEALSRELDAYLSELNRVATPANGLLVVGGGVVIGLSVFALAMLAKDEQAAPDPRPVAAVVSETSPAPEPEPRPTAAELKAKARNAQVVAILEAIPKDPATALELAERLVTEAPLEAVAWAARARVRYFTGDYAACHEDLAQALARNPSSGLALETRGQLREREGDLAGARNDLEAVVEILPRWSEAWVSLGIVRARQEDFGAGLAAFDTALKLAPRHTNALANRALLLVRMNDVRAVKSFDLALEQHAPGDPRGDQLAASLSTFLGALEQAQTKLSPEDPQWELIRRVLRRGKRALEAYSSRQ